MFDLLASEFGGFVFAFVSGTVIFGLAYLFGLATAPVLQFVLSGDDEETTNHTLDRSNS